MKSRLPKKPRFDENLVADQPGRKIFFSGLILALVLGWMVRGAIAPGKIQGMVQEASQRIHKDVQVKFDKAEVSLSVNGFPRLALVVTKVSLVSDVRCWGRPILTAEQITFPVSIRSYLLERQVFKKVIAHHVDLRLRAQPGACDATAPTTTEASAPVAVKAVTLTQRKKDFEIQVKPVLDQLEVDRLRLQYDPVPEAGFEVADLLLRVNSQQPREIVLEANTHVMSDSVLARFGSQGKVSVVYQEAPDQSLRVQFNGNWREGSYALNANYRFADKVVVASTELKHIPGAQVIAALRNYGGLREDWDGRRIWVTMRGQSQGFLDRWQQMPVFITDFKIEGDLGEIEIDQFEALALQPFRFKPLQARVKSLDVDRLMEFLKRPSPWEFLGRLGQFTGRLEMAADNQLCLLGRHAGLEFIFSNRGERQVQVISALDGDLSLNKNLWDLNLQNIELKNGVFKGDLQLQSDRDLKRIQMDLTTEDLTLSPDVQDLMGGKIGSLKTQLKLVMADGALETMRGTLRSPLVDVDQMSFEKLNTQFEFRKGNLDLKLGADMLKIGANAKAHTWLKDILKTDAPDYTFKQLSGRFTMTPQREMQWRGLSAVEDSKNIRLTSDGQWTAAGFLNGTMRVGPQQRWSIDGHRDQPRLRELAK